jgi:hypothetical protein
MNNFNISNSTNYNHSNLEVNKTDSTYTIIEEYNLLTILHFLLITFVAMHLIYFIFYLIKNNLCFKKAPSQSLQDNLRKINDECSICLDNILNEVQLLCSHSFCASCIVDYGKQRWGFVNIQCPICRSESKLMITQFERSEENKGLYDTIVAYNYDLTAAYSTSFCLCFDIFKFSFFYFRQISNFSNPRYRGHRTIIILAIIIFLVYVVYPEKYISDHLEILEDVLSYLFLIILCSENFYRRFRMQTNNEFMLYESEINGNVSGIEENSSVNSDNDRNGEGGTGSNIDFPNDRINVDNNINQV